VAYALSDDIKTIGLRWPLRSVTTGTVRFTHRDLFATTRLFYKYIQNYLLWDVAHLLYHKLYSKFAANQNIRVGGCLSRQSLCSGCAFDRSSVSTLTFARDGLIAGCATTRQSRTCLSTFPITASTNSGCPTFTFQTKRIREHTRIWRPTGVFASTQTAQFDTWQGRPKQFLKTFCIKKKRLMSGTVLFVCYLRCLLSYQVITKIVCFLSARIKLLKKDSLLKKIHARRLEKVWLLGRPER